MITEKQIHELADTLREGVKLNFERDGGLHPAAIFVLRAGDSYAIAPMIWGAGEFTEDGKEVFARAMHTTVQVAESQGMPCLAVVFMSEAWMRFVPLAESRDPSKLDPRVSSHPDRIEVVDFVLETERGCWGWTAEIDRSGEKPVLKPWTTRGGQATGRFAGFIQRGRA